MDLPDAFVIAAAGALGLIFGSFGTVVAYRVPKQESVVTGRSKCPNCGHTITALENIPVLSYLFLRGRCRNCGTRISPRYPLIELVTGVLFAAAAAKFDLSGEAVAYAGLFWALVVLTVIDLEERKLPDALTFPLFVVGLGALGIISVADDALGDLSIITIVSVAVILAVLAAMYPWLPSHRAAKEEPETDLASEKDEPERALASEKDEPVAPSSPQARASLNPWGVLVLAGWVAFLGYAFLEGEQTRFAGALLGAALFSGFFFAIAFTYIGGMGGGDVKLSLVLGAFAGYLGSPGNVIVAMFSALVVGGVVSAIVLFAGGSRKTALPFGPFLALGTIIAIFWGDAIQNFYGSTL